MARGRLDDAAGQYLANPQDRPELEDELLAAHDQARAALANANAKP